jgi:hypothetical protein
MDTPSLRRRLLDTIRKDRTDQGDRPKDDDRSSRSRSSSRVRLFKHSPSQQDEKAQNALSTTDINGSSSNVALDDNKAEQLGGQSGAKPAAADRDMNNDMWKIAEEELRRDPQKREILEKYDHILEAHFKSKLEPIGSLERRQQFLGFRNSELASLSPAGTDTKLSRCSNKAKSLVKGTVSTIVASKDIITSATAACLPASIACTGVMVLLSVRLAPCKTIRD